MARQRGVYPTKNMKPIFLVFCEGETEREYLTFVKNAFRSPIKIITKVEGNSISQRLIDKRKVELKISGREQLRVFLMYDMDVPEVVDKLRKCQAELLLSNPCVEVWFLLHCKSLKSPLTSEQAIKSLQDIGGVWAKYRKAELSDTQKTFLSEYVEVAIKRAKSLPMQENPSSDIFRLIEAVRPAE